MYYLNPDVEHLNRIFDQNMREPYLRLDLNENPGGLPKEFVQKVLSEVTPEFVAQYPETLPFAETLSKKLGTGVENVCLVNGSSEGIRNIIFAFSSRGGRIVGVTPTYAMFAVYSDMYGRDFVPVRYNEDLTIDVDRILEAMKEHYKDEKVNTIDGVKIDFEATRRWVHLRRSNTEPIIRIYSEAPTQEQAESLAREVVSLANEVIANV